MNYMTLRRVCWRTLPVAIQRPIIRFLRRTEYSDTLTVRQFAEFARSRFHDELVVSPTGEVWFRDSSGGEFFVPFDRTDFIGCGVTGTEPLESDLLANNLADGTMLDIGANVGIHSIRVALKRPEASVFAFEPVPANHAVLVKNIARNRLEQRVCAIHAAVGASNGTVTMPTSFGTGNWVGGQISGVRNEKIPLQTIDFFLKERGSIKVSLVKCDVEGYELHVLQGMTACLSNMRPRLLLEVDEGWCARLGSHAVDVFALLRGLGYQHMRVVQSIGLKEPLATVSESLASTSNFWFFPEEIGPGHIGGAE